MRPSLELIAMTKGREKGLVFVTPDYHCSFIYRDHLRRLGWRADIFVPAEYPRVLLFEEPDIQGMDLRTKNFWELAAAALRMQLLYFRLIRRYKFHVYHGTLETFTILERVPGMGFLLRRSFRLNLSLARIAGVKIIYIPSGAPDEELPAIIAELGNAQEGLSLRDTDEMRVHFRLLNRYSNLCVGIGTLDSSQYSATHLKYKVIDLFRWRPDLEIPEQYQLEKFEGIRILHSFMFGSERTALQGGNIKGSKYVSEAVKRLRSEGYRVELLSFDGIPSRDYRYLQSQADIVVDQLIRGNWGSTAIEAIALGKPVVTFVRREWESFYYSLFPETRPLPFVNADRWTIYSHLKDLLDNPDQIDRIGRESRKWAELHLNPMLNVSAFISAIESI